MKRQPLLIGLLVAMTLLLTACPGGNGPSSPNTLTVELSGSGTVTSSPEGITCGEDCTEDFSDNTEVTLTADPADGFEFDSFSDNCAVEAGTNNICVVTMDEAKTVTVTFRPAGGADSYLLTVSLTGQGSGSVTSTSDGIDCPDDCDETFNSGTVVTLTAEADDGSEFVSFSNCLADAADANVCTVTMDAAKTVEANFRPEGAESFQLDVSVVGEGSVTSDPEGIDCPDDCSAVFDTATVVTLTATADEGFELTGFSNNCSVDATNAAVCTVDVSNASAATAVTATFEAAGPSDPELTVDFIGSGSGIVNIGGVNYTGDFTTTFSEGTSTTLIAVAGENSTALAWGGACASDDLNDCTLTMDEDKTVTIAFGADGAFQTVNDPVPLTPVPSITSNDAEEYLDNLDRDGDSGTTDDIDITGTVKLYSGDLDLPYEDQSTGVQQVVGIRFPDLDIPQGATILSAVIRLRNKVSVPDSADQPEPVLTIKVQDSLTAPEFTSTNSNITSRGTTDGSLEWRPGTWQGNQAYNSPNLTALVQELVNDENWTQGDKTNGTTLENALAFIISGNETTNRRIAFSVEDDGSADPIPSGFAPRLVINYEVPPTE